MNCCAIMDKTKMLNHFNNKLRIALRYPEIAFSVFYRQFLYNLYKYHWLHHGNVRTLPCELVILASKKCFLDCATCGTKAMYGSDDKFSDFLELKYMKKIADDVSKWRTPIYAKITGGEITMHPHFLEILDY